MKYLASLFFLIPLLTFSQYSNYYTVDVNSNSNGLIINPGSGSFDDGIVIIGAGSDGLQVNSSGRNGLWVVGTVQSGIRIDSQMTDVGN